MSWTSLHRWLRRPAVLIPIVAIALGLPLVLVARSTSGDGASALSVAGAVLVVLLVLALVQVVRMLAGVDPDVPELAERLVGGPEEQRLVARWLSRARWARDVGGFTGLVIWVLGTQMNGDVLLWGVGGIAVGAMAAELHHVKPGSDRRTASLDVRSISDYLRDGDRRRMIGVGAVGGLLAATGFALDGVGPAAVAGLAAMAVLGAAWAVQWRIATRPRPAISERLRKADDLARGLAIGRGLARPASFFALAFIARGSWLLVPSIGDVGGVIAVVTWLYAFSLWWTNRRLGLDYLLREAHAVSA